MRPGTMEFLVILAVVLLVFGPTQIPKLTKMFGKMSRDMKNGMEEGTAEADAEAKARNAKEASTEEAGE